ncbi:MAG: hypothetical protein GWP04_10695 [Gammaproteobacteria bacterium]|nr:hypothetical protein [Gammaproteobacteria bacterium]
MKTAALVTIATLLIGACSPEATTTTVTTSTTTAPATAPATTTTSVLDVCDPPNFLPTMLPVRVTADQPASRDVPFDQFTTIPGTTIRLWAGASGAPVMVMIRGALPPERWTATPERIVVRGVDAALGPLQDGVWAVAWFEGPDTCDEYSLVFYPPVDLTEIRAVAESVPGRG